MCLDISENFQWLSERWNMYRTFLSLGATISQMCRIISIWRDLWRLDSPTAKSKMDYQYFTMIWSWMKCDCMCLCGSSRGAAGLASVRKVQKNSTRVNSSHLQNGSTAGQSWASEWHWLHPYDNVFKTWKNAGQQKLGERREKVITDTSVSEEGGKEVPQMPDQKLFATHGPQNHGKAVCSPTVHGVPRKIISSHFSP